MRSERIAGGKYTICAVQIALLILGVLAYRDAPRLYYSYLSVMGGIPTDGPFSDLHFVFAAFDCLRHGIDPYFNGSCMPKAEPFNYAPALLWLAALPMNSGWTLPAGLVLDLLFFLSSSCYPSRALAPNSSCACWPDSRARLPTPPSPPISISSCSC